MKTLLDGMRRREFLAGGLSIAAGVSRAAAQPATAMRRLAIFSPSEPAALMHEKSENRYYRALFAELRRLGHVEGAKPHRRTLWQGEEYIGACGTGRRGRAPKS